MSRQPLSRWSVTRQPAEETAETPSVEVARADLCALDADRHKHIDRYIDYFGGGAALGNERFRHSRRVEVLVMKGRKLGASGDSPDRACTR